jgi:hypothetical protein
MVPEVCFKEPGDAKILVLPLQLLFSIIYLIGHWNAQLSVRPRKVELVHAIITTKAAPPCMNTNKFQCASGVEY